MAFDRWSRAAVTLLILGCTLIAGCPESPMGDPDAGVWSAGEFCERYEQEVCDRDFALGHITAGEQSECIRQVGARCEGVGWPGGCTPTMERIDLCIDAFYDGERIDEPSRSFPECVVETICGG